MPRYCGCPGEGHVAPCPLFYYKSVADYEKIFEPTDTEKEN